MVSLPVGVNPPNFQSREGYREDKERKRDIKRERMPLPVGVDPQAFRAKRNIERIRRERERAIKKEREKERMRDTKRERDCLCL